MQASFKNIFEFNDYFKDEKTCYAFIEHFRWSGVVVCPHCATVKQPYKVKPRGMFKEIPSYRCSEKHCDLPFTVRTGSIMEGSKIEARKWLQAGYEISISKKGISSVELSTRIDVSQKTAWFMLHRLRATMQDFNPSMLVGTIEADETFIGGLEKNKHMKKRINKPKVGKRTEKRKNVEKTVVLGLMERGGKVRTYVVPNTQADTLQSIMRAKIEPTSRIITDAHKSYIELKDDYTHVSIKHSFGNYVTYGDEHTNNIEGFWSILKRGIVGTFHFVSPQHLQRYCNEFSHRYNNRKDGNVATLVDYINNAHKARLTYKTLTNYKTKES